MLDLPLLEMDYATWSAQQFHALHGLRKELAKPWCDAVEQLDLHQEANEQTLAAIAASYTDYLHQCKASGLHWVQPGRFVLPGELEGAPVLQFSRVMRRRLSEQAELLRFAASALSGVPKQGGKSLL